MLGPCSHRLGGNISLLGTVPTPTIPALDPPPGRCRCCYQSPLPPPWSYPIPSQPFRRLLCPHYAALQPPPCWYHFPASYPRAHCRCCYQSPLPPPWSYPIPSQPFRRLLCTLGCPAAVGIARPTTSFSPSFPNPPPSLSSSPRSLLVPSPSLPPSLHPSLPRSPNTCTEQDIRILRTRAPRPDPHD